MGMPFTMWASAPEIEDSVEQYTSLSDKEACNSLLFAIENFYWRPLK
jgi:hypothetical protein